MPIAFPGDTSRPSTTEASTTDIAFRWQRTSSRSRRPQKGVSSHSTKTNSASRKVRYAVPTACSACMAVMIASMTSRLSRHRNTFGRTMILRFTVSATTIASGRDPCVMSLPTVFGIGITD